MLSLCVGTLELCTRALSSMLKHECNPVCEGPERSICTFGIWFCKLCALTSQHWIHDNDSRLRVHSATRARVPVQSKQKGSFSDNLLKKRGYTLWFLHVVLSGGAAGNRAGTRNSRCSASLLKIRGSHFSVSFSRAVGPGIVGTPKF